MIESGMKFGMLTALKPSGYMANGGSRAIAWDFRCDCGAVKRAKVHELRYGRRTSCGCTSKTALKDLSGQTFTKWTVLSRAGNRGGRTAWKCKCLCGTERDVASVHLVSGASVSCGCIKREITSPRQTHGQSKTDVYGIWCQMVARCHNPANTSFSKYGAKGVSVCAAWREDFAAFSGHIGPRPSMLHTVDRIETTGNYEPGNVRWATKKQQANNTRRNRFVEVRGERLTLAQAVERYGGNYGTVKWRMRSKGMTAEQALGL